jgi:gentisate 1,2-dioxygenase
MGKEGTPALDQLNRELAQGYMRGLWARDIPERGEPRPFGPPHVWKWEAIHRGLSAAADLVSLDRFGVRRNIGLVNPGLVEQGAFASATMTMGFQLVKPGETALAHRHTASAIRFIVEGEVGAYTVVNGEKCTMERGDLVLTPNWHWHDHHNETDRPVIWIDGLDAPIGMALRAGFTEPHHDAKGQPLKSAVDYAERNPAGYGVPGQAARRLVFKWEDTLAALEGLDSTSKSPYDGRCLEYRNEAYGGHTLKTFTCWIQMLDPGEETQCHRHTTTHLYHAFEGEGSTLAGDKELRWEKGDCFVIPNWTWHRHRNSSRTEPAILFSMNDLPAQEAFDLYREEKSES